MIATAPAAIMAAHAPAVVAADDGLTALYRKLEYFPTPPWAGRAIGEALRALDPEGCAVAWEPACGQGHMAAALAGSFLQVVATDIHDHGTAWQARTADFLDPELMTAGADFWPCAGVHGVDWIVTNPPFGVAADFVRLGLARAARGVAVLCRSGWLDSAGRWPHFYGEDAPCDLELAFFDRVSMALGRWEPRSTAKGGSTATPYSLFVWFADGARPAWLSAAQAAVRAGPMGHGIVTLAIPPGTKARLTRPDDARLWGAKADAPLFDDFCGAVVSADALDPTRPDDGEADHA